jgi:hypothetical protein
LELDRTSAAAIAQGYFSTAAPLISLGWGISGFVYLSPDALSVVKVHRHEDSFQREVDVYRRLRELRITSLHGLTIPKLIGHRADLRVIHMDVVSAPYLLDFAGVRFTPPDFTDEVMESWHAGIHEMFGPNAHIAYAVYHTLARRGLYYMDLRPSNLNVTGLPGVQPARPAEDE